MSKNPHGPDIARKASTTSGQTVKSAPAAPKVTLLPEQVPPPKVLQKLGLKNNPL